VIGWRFTWLGGCESIGQNCGGSNPTWQIVFLWTSIGAALRRMAAQFNDVEVPHPASCISRSRCRRIWAASADVLARAMARLTFSGSSLSYLRAAAGDGAANPSSIRRAYFPK